jgi:ketosteroid isomerase-like protein
MRAAAVSSLVGTLVAGFACSPAPTPVADTGAALAALREADAAYARAGTARDLEAFVAFYAQDASAHPPGEPPVTGAAAIQAYLGRIFQDTAFAARFQPVSAVVSNDGTMGYTLNGAELRVTGANGKPMSERIRDFHVWRRQADGSWKLVIDIWNAVP